MSNGTLIEPETWEQACAQALAEVSCAMPAFNLELSTAAKAAVTSDNLRNELPYTFRSLGRMWYFEASAYCTDEEIVNELAEKQRRYGHQNILGFGELGIRVRLCDKMERIINAHKMERPEDTEDPIFDALGYCVLGVMLEQGTFGLPLAEDIVPPAIEKLRVPSPGQHWDWQGVVDTVNTLIDKVSDIEDWIGDRD